MTEEIRIPSNGGFLAGVVHRPTELKLTKAVLVMCHGFRGSKEGGGRATRLAEKAALLGISVVRFDFTPLQTLTRQVEELGHVVEFARKNLGERIFLLGRSMGGSACLAHTDKYQDIAGLCLWATPWGLEETFRLALGEHYQQLEQGQAVKLNDEYGEAVITPAFVQDFTCYDLLTSVRNLCGIPLLQVHGSSDGIVPLQQAFDIHLAACEPKQLVVIEGGDHHLAEHAEIASGHVLSWLKSVI